MYKECKKKNPFVNFELFWNKIVFRTIRGKIKTKKGFYP